MSEVLIKDLSNSVVLALDAHTKMLGVCTAEYLRRLVVRDTSAVWSAVTVEDLDAVADRHADLDDPEVMAGAWDRTTG